MQHEIGNRTYIVADVAPLDVDGVRTVEVGTGLWLLAFIGLKQVKQVKAPERAIEQGKQIPQALKGKG